ncbi:hypothetical protein KAI65_01055 [Candidatus Parcubacteria bacterium]|nr:hypothetical protein [Candidatus Parcubacteria bacterium]
MPKSEIIIRNAKHGDWIGFKKVDEAGFNDSGIELITMEQFNAWLTVFPKGFFVAEKNGKISGYIYLQICDFDPLDVNDIRNFNEITDNGYTYKTHNPDEFCLYVVSVAAVDSGTGRKLVSETIKLTKKYKKKYYAGVCRMSGLNRFIKKNKLKPTIENISLYAELVSDSVKGKRKGKIKYFDPVLSVLLKVKDSKFSRLIKNFLKDKQSLNWTSVIYYKNEDSN